LKYLGQTTTMSAYKIKKLIVLIFITLCSISTYSQNREIDSLKNLLENTSVDTAKVYRMYKISDQYFNLTVHDTAMLYARQAYKLA